MTGLGPRKGRGLHSPQDLTARSEFRETRGENPLIRNREADGFDARRARRRRPATQANPQ